MAYGVTNLDNKIEVSLFTLKDKNRVTITGSSVNVKEVLTIKEARAFARDIYAYCRIAESNEVKND